MKIVLLMVILVGVLGCATTAKLEAKMQARVGQNINDVVEQIGPPHQTFTKPNGDIVYTWVNTGPTRAAASTDIFGHPLGAVDIQSSGCDVSYTADSRGIIKSWQHRGNICRSR